MPYKQVNAWRNDCIVLDFDYLLAAKRATTFGGSGIHIGAFRVIRCSEAVAMTTAGI